MENIETVDVENYAARKIQTYWRNHREIKTKSVPSPEATEYTDEQYSSALIPSPEATEYTNEQYSSALIPSPEATEYTDEQYLSALIIQNFYRDYISRKQLRSEKEDAARLIQYHYRQYLRKSEEEFEADLERAAKIAQESYNKLQSENEYNLESTSYEENNSLAIILSSNEETVSSEYDRQTDAATIIQRRYRKHLEAQKKEMLCEKGNKTAIRIQIDDVSYCSDERDLGVDDSDNIETPTDVNMPSASDNPSKYPDEHGDESGSDDHARQTDAAIIIQRRYRRHLQVHQEKMLREKRNNAAICIQQQYRKYAEKNNVTIKTNTDDKRTDSSGENTACLDPKIENTDLSKTSDNSLKSSDEEYIPEVAAMTIQKHYKRHYNKRVSAATLIQHQFRSYKNSSMTKKETSPFSDDGYIKFPGQDTSSEEVRAATLIQRQYRAHLLNMSERSYDLPGDSPEILGLADDSVENSEYFGDCNDPTLGNMYLELNGKDESETFENTMNARALVDNEIIADDRASDDSGAIEDDVSTTTDGKSGDDGFINWQDSILTREPGSDKRMSLEATAPRYSKDPKFHTKPARKFDKQWPESKRSQHQKVKESPRKKQVQVSLDMKREQRRNEKNKRKDKFHLSNLRKQAPNPKFTEAASKKLVNGQRNVKKTDTPQLKEKRQPHYPPPEPELMDLLDSTEEESSPITVQTAELQTTSPEFRTSEDKKSATVTQTNNNNTVQRPADNINVYHTKSSHITGNAARRPGAVHAKDTRSVRVARHSSEPPQNARNGRVARRLSDQSSLSSVHHHLSTQNKAAQLGTLDSYAVQNLLKRNDLLTRQRNDNHSYLQSYLKQMNLINRPSPTVPNQQPIAKQRQGWTRKSYSEQMPGNLEKIAKYGRNGQPETWKSLVENSTNGVSGAKGASRGSYYPVLPAYGKMKENVVNQSSHQLNEIPWPRDIG